MPKYIVSVRGAGILLLVDGQLTQCGFLTTRIVDAVDAREAFLRASDLVRVRLQKTEGMQGPFTLLEDEIHRLDDSADREAQEPGFIWFPEDGVTVGGQRPTPPSDQQ